MRRGRGRSLKARTHSKRDERRTSEILRDLTGCRVVAFVRSKNGDDCDAAEHKQHASHVRKRQALCLRHAANGSEEEGEDNGETSKWRYHAERQNGEGDHLIWESDA